MTLAHTLRDVVIRAVDMKLKKLKITRKDAIKALMEVYDGEYQRALKERDEAVREAREAKTFNGLRCSVCDEPQFETKGGAVCCNGHGGAEGYND